MQILVIEFPRVTVVLTYMVTTIFTCVYLVRFDSDERSEDLQLNYKFGNWRDSSEITVLALHMTDHALISPELHLVS